MQIQWQPTDRQLRQFGATALFALPLVAWLWTRSSTAAGWGVLIGGVLAAVGVVRPQWLRPVFLGLSLIGWPIGVVVGEAALACVYYGVLTPIAVVGRIAGKFRMPRGPDPGAATYWERRAPAPGPQQYRQQW